MASAVTYILLQNGTLLIHDDSDHVTPHFNTDLLIRGDTITAIGSKLEVPSDQIVRTIDCTNKIISPGFIDTHHHLWQTQLKGRHADETLLDYFPSGMFQSYNYTPTDIFWGQLSGALESIGAGTTFILDHMHGAYTQTHADSALQASIASGIRGVFALAAPLRLQSWTKEECTLVNDNDPVPEWNLTFIESAAKSQPIASRIYVGLGFDAFYLPQPFITSLYARVRAAGVHLVTTHIGDNGVYWHDPISLMQSYNLLSSDMVASHATNLTPSKRKILFDAGIYSSSTPETEAQMGLGWPCALDDNVHGCLGVDCHTNNSASILVQARMLLQHIRGRDAQLHFGKGTLQKKPTSTTEQAFNLATIHGARAVRMEAEIGSIKVGKKADLVIFDSANSPGMLCAAEYDPLVAVLRHSDVGDIDTVIIGGIVRKEGGKLCAVEIDGKEAPYSTVAESTLASQKEIYKKIEGQSWEKAREMIVGLYHVDESKIL